MFGHLLYEETRKAKRAAKQVLDFAVNSIIKNYKENTKASKDTVIGRIMNNPCYKDDYERARDLIVFLIAGHDTTGLTIAWTLIELARNPSEIVALRKELKACKSQEEWRSCQGVRNLIKEGMRKHSVGPVHGVRDCNKDFYSIKVVCTAFTRAPKSSGFCTISRPPHSAPCVFLLICLLRALRQLLHKCLPQ